MLIAQGFFLYEFSDRLAPFNPRGLIAQGFFYMNFLPVSMRLIKMLQKNIKKGAKKGICLQEKQIFEVIECKVGPHAICGGANPARSGRKQR